MFFLKDLFKKNNVNCPEWLSYEMIGDEWKDSKYSIEDNTHKWTLKNSFQHLVITFNGERYCFTAFKDGIPHRISEITEEYEINY